MKNKLKKSEEKKRYKHNIDVAKTSNKQEKKKVSTKKLMLFVGLLLLVVASVAWVNLIQEEKHEDEIVLKEGQSVSGQIYGLSNEDAQKVIKNKSSNEDTTYAKALAYAKLENYKAAEEQFKKITEQGNAPYFVYQDQSTVYINSGKVDLAIKSLESAIAALKTDTNVGQNVKSTETKKLESKLAWLKMELAR